MKKLLVEVIEKKIANNLIVCTILTIILLPHLFSLLKAVKTRISVGGQHIAIVLSTFQCKPAPFLKVKEERTGLADILCVDSGWI